MTIADVEAMIAAHVPNHDGACLGCRDNGEDELYPCHPVAFAWRASDLLARRLTGDGSGQRSGAVKVDLSRATWRRSARTGSASGVEVAFVGDAVAIRNADGPDGPILIYTRQDWEAFISGVRDGEFAS